MKFETLKDRKYFFYVLLVVVILLVTIILTTSLAKYKVTESINIASGTINYSPSDFSLMGIYIESDSGYTQTDTIPESGYELNSEESYCKIGDTIQDTTISYDVSTLTLNIMPMTNKGLKCYLYFDIEIEKMTIQDILSSMTKSTRTTFSSIYTASTTNTVFSATDDDGDSYYYAGAPTDNWVKFAGFYWRIIRINGDGTIRLIYQGTVANTTGTGTQIETGAFNASYDNNMYVGFMYTSGIVHGLGTSSTIKNALDDWYDNNLTNYSSYIDINAGFCGDRQPSTSSSSINGSGGTETTTTYYAAKNRLNTNKAPTLKCANSSDLYTLTNSNKGNKNLIKPIGLITADEVAYAGGVYNIDSSVNNTSYYLYTGQIYWTLTPHSYDFTTGKNTANIFDIANTGLIGYYPTSSSTLGIRPVINLRADTKFKRNTLGTADSPYEVI